MVRTINEIVAEVDQISKRKTSVVARIDASMNSFYANHEPIETAQNIFDNEWGSVIEVGDEVPARERVVKELTEDGLVGTLDTPATDEETFEAYFQAPRSIVLGKINNLTHRKAKDGRKSLVDAVIANANSGAENNPEAVFDVMDYFVAHSSDDEAIRFIREVGSSLYQSSFNEKAHYTHTEKALAVYQHALLNGQADDAFTSAFARFARGVEPSEPLMEGMGSAMGWQGRKQRFDKFVASVSNGGGKAVTAFLSSIPQELMGLRDSYQGLPEDSRGHFKVDDAIQEAIPLEIRDVPHLSDMCLNAGRRYVVNS